MFFPCVDLFNFFEILYDFISFRSSTFLVYFDYLTYTFYEITYQFGVSHNCENFNKFFVYQAFFSLKFVSPYSFEIGFYYNLKNNNTYVFSFLTIKNFFVNLFRSLFRIETSNRKNFFMVGTQNFLVFDPFFFKGVFFEIFYSNFDNYFSSLEPQLFHLSEDISFMFCYKKGCSSFFNYKIPVMVFLEFFGFSIAPRVIFKNNNNFLSYNQFLKRKKKWYYKNNVIGLKNRFPIEKITSKPSIADKVLLESDLLNRFDNYRIFDFVIPRRPYEFGELLGRRSWLRMDSLNTPIYKKDKKRGERPEKSIFDFYPYLNRSDRLAFFRYRSLSIFNNFLFSSYNYNRNFSRNIFYYFNFNKKKVRKKRNYRRRFKAVSFNIFKKVVSFFGNFLVFKRRFRYIFSFLKFFSYCFNYNRLLKNFFDGLFYKRDGEVLVLNKCEISIGGLRRKKPDSFFIIRRRIFERRFFRKYFRRFTKTRFNSRKIFFHIRKIKKFKFINNSYYNKVFNLKKKTFVRKFWFKEKRFNKKNLKSLKRKVFFSNLTPKFFIKGSKIHFLKFDLKYKLKFFTRKNSDRRVKRLKFIFRKKFGGCKKVKWLSTSLLFKKRNFYRRFLKFRFLPSFRRQTLFDISLLGSKFRSFSILSDKKKSSFFNKILFNRRFFLFRNLTLRKRKVFLFSFIKKSNNNCLFTDDNGKKVFDSLSNKHNVKVYSKRLHHFQYTHNINSFLNLSHLDKSGEFKKNFLFYIYASPFSCLNYNMVFKYKFYLFERHENKNFFSNFSFHAKNRFNFYPTSKFRKIMLYILPKFIMPFSIFNNLFFKSSFLLNWSSIKSSFFVLKPSINLIFSFFRFVFGVFFTSSSGYFFFTKNTYSKFKSFFVDVFPFYSFFNFIFFYFFSLLFKIFNSRLLSMFNMLFFVNFFDSVKNAERFFFKSFFSNFFFFNFLFDNNQKIFSLLSISKSNNELVKSFFNDNFLFYLNYKYSSIFFRKRLLKKSLFFKEGFGNRNSKNFYKKTSFNLKGKKSVNTFFNLEKYSLLKKYQTPIISNLRRSQKLNFLSKVKFKLSSVDYYFNNFDSSFFFFRSFINDYNNNYKKLTFLKNSNFFLFDSASSFFGQEFSLLSCNDFKDRYFNLVSIRSSKFSFLFDDYLFMLFKPLKVFNFSRRCNTIFIFFFERLDRFFYFYRFIYNQSFDGLFQNLFFVDTVDVLAESYLSNFDFYKNYKKNPDLFLNSNYPNFERRNYINYMSSLYVLIDIFQNATEDDDDMSISDLTQDIGYNTINTLIPIFLRTSIERSISRKKAYASSSWRRTARYYVMNGGDPSESEDWTYMMYEFATFDFFDELLNSFLTLGVFAIFFLVDLDFLLVEFDVSLYQHWRLFDLFGI